MQKKSTSSSAFFNLRALIGLLLCAATVYFILIPIRSGLAFLHPQVPSNGSQRTLTFEERVSYQHAIEDVYWRHRIWPKERPDPKPSLDAMMPKTQLEKKVNDYLRNSQALEDYWKRPITAEQLQAEMDRMAKNTRQPEVLQELFDALGNDPFVIAECLARPALAERLLTSWYAFDQRIHGELKQHAEADLQSHRTVEQMKQMSGKHGEIELVRSDTPQGKQDRGAQHSVTLNSREWDETIRKLAVMLGEVPHASARRSNAIGAVARAAKGTPINIKVVSPLQEDKERYYGMAVIDQTKDRLKLATVAWVKQPLESWLAGAENQVGNAAVPTDRYTIPTVSGGGCIDDTWTGTAGPPDAREGSTAVWTGSEMIIWGGEIYSVTSFSSGGRYNPSTDTWTATSGVNAPTARAYHSGVWTGNEMIIWGGRDASFNLLNSGGRYDPTADSWTATTTTNAPDVRDAHTAVWTGSQMIVWGGESSFGYSSTGGRYNPGTDSWTATSTINAPSGRWHHTAVWTGSIMVVWGGFDGSNDLNTGGRYDPGTNSWTPTSTSNAPANRENHTAIWDGSEMIVWGGADFGLFTFYNSGGRYNPSTNSWIATSITNAADGRESHTAIWTGSEMVVWGGADDMAAFNTGGRYNPTTNSWTATSLSNAPSARELHTAVWTGSEMIVWGGGFALNDGGRYNPGTNSWVTIGNNGAPSGRINHTGVWIGSEMIVWAGYSPGAGGAVNTGGKYDSGTDSWTATNSVDAPIARTGHTALWTGTEMIVWGGEDNNFSYLDSGGRYDPSMNSWAGTSTANAAAGRTAHTAVWTGNEMVVWGGVGDSGELNAGGRYNPGTNSWTAISTTNAPTERYFHTAIWSGSEMIVWGGYDQFIGALDTGGRYDPEANSWTATSTVNVPTARSEHTAVWTGTEMIVFGGNVGISWNTGARYNPSTDSWVATSDAPAGRTGHTAVWTGSEMIVWGGSSDSGDSNTGGSYNPSTNGWTTTSTINAPSVRRGHTAVWTDTEMIVWGGGIQLETYWNSGGRYCAQSGPPPTPTPTVSPTPTPRVTPRPRPTPRHRPTPP